ncbi:MAG TPA: hypothetical protein VMA73_11060 [Streptosporangiaceae bacterium]|nr:hypothetical protein [Streptosporangiaceae bacterium]
MTSPRDEIDNWLARDVTPLYPPAGSLDRIRRRARQRKTRQATITAAGCAVVLAGAVVTPQLLATGQQSVHHRLPTIAIAPSSPAVQPNISPTGHTPPQVSGKATQIEQHTTLTKSWTRPPGHFRPTSVTFVGNGNGGVIGAVIGQAGPPCASKDCTSLAGTSDYGQTWDGVSAPYAPGPTGVAGVSQLRFASTSDGWAYGPALYETSHGGWPWKPEKTYGQHVIDVEAAPADPASGVPARAFAVFGSCTGTGIDYATNCTSYSLWTSVAGSKTWTQVQLPAAYQQLTSTSSAASAAPQLIISGGTTAYLLTPSGEVLSGPTSGGSWHAVGAAPCSPGPGGASDQASQSSAGPSSGTQSSPSPSSGTQGSGSKGYGAELAAGPQLLLSCDSKAAAAQVTVYTSTDGARWHQAGSLTVPGSPTSLSAAGTSAASAEAVLATTAGIEYSTNGGRTWQAAKFGGATTGEAGPSGGFSYVGMTNATQGVAVPANSSLDEIYVTGDGGSTWQPSPITG